MNKNKIVSKVQFKNSIEVLQRINSEVITPSVLKYMGIKSEDNIDVLLYLYNFKDHRFEFENKNYELMFYNLIDKIQLSKIPDGPKNTALGVYKYLEGNLKICPPNSILMDYLINLKPEYWQKDWIYYIQRIYIDKHNKIYEINSNGYFEIPITKIFSTFIRIHSKAKIKKEIDI